MLRDRARALGYVAGALACFAAVKVGEPWGGNYAMQYGNFIASAGELALRLHMLVFVLPATVLLAAAAAQTGLPARLARGFEALRAPSRFLLWAGLLAAIVLATSATARTLVLRNTVMTDDENVYHFQAQLVASGRVSAESPPPGVRAFFDNQFIVNNGRWFGTYFLGHATVLAMAGLVGLDEWVNSLQAALTALVAMAIARRLLGVRAALLTGLALVVSPFFTLVSATHLSQPTSSLAIATFVYACLHLEAAPRKPASWALAAAALTFAALVRPQTAVFLSLPWLIRLLVLLVRGRLRPGWAGPLAACVVLAAAAAIFFGINRAISGSAFRTAYHVAWAEGVPWMFPVGPRYTLREISQNLMQLDFWLLGWPVSLAFVPFFRRDGQTWALAAMPIAELLGYGIAAVPSVAAVGPVYYAESIVPLAILSASGIEQATALARERWGGPRAAGTVLAWALAGVIGCLVVWLPLHVRSLRAMSAITRAPYALVEARGLRNAVVFVHSLPARHQRPGSWAYLHRNNSPDLSDPVLFVHDLGPERNRLLLEYLPGRAGYRMVTHENELLLLPIDR